MRLLLVSTWFQLGWFLCVLGKETWQWAALGYVIATLLWSWKTQPRQLKSIAIVAISGIVLDSINQQVELLNFVSDALPLWMVCLWWLFAWYASQLISVIRRFRRAQVCLIGGIAGALSYIAGEQLGAVQFGYGFLLTAFILLMQWILITFCILKVYDNENFVRESAC
ncbi:hypothetical protein EA26_15855 [Vibrio navarrensis]|uniref:Zinc ABC transporter permease n=2 Tax=Vibrio navarrensis TaxID=29495 RepID=A0A099LKK9_9VIBR|nr:hypothetical protein EA26_15855 [Vibrio navarrensis]MBE4614445.1 hypothetical protein [Vibrio navarrensis]QOD71417.1 DUF2878 domain-containing protein [Vibrio navarrensis]